MYIFTELKKWGFGKLVGQHIHMLTPDFIEKCTLSWFDFFNLTIKFTLVFILPI